MSERTQPSPPSEPPWLVIARRELGIKERAGASDHPRIVEYLHTVIRGPVHDEVPWCSAFANWCMVQAGVRGTGSAAARSWLTWGVELHEPCLGCVVVMRRGPPNDTVHGHVAFFERADHEWLWVLGGNQRNMVCVSPRPREDVLEYRWLKPL